MNVNQKVDELNEDRELLPAKRVTKILPETLRNHMKRSGGLISLQLDTLHGNQIGSVEIQACYDRENKKILFPEVAQWIERANTYVEFAPDFGPPEGIRIIGYIEHGRSSERIHWKEGHPDPTIKYCSVITVHSHPKPIEVSGVPIVDKEFSDINWLVDEVLSFAKPSGANAQQMTDKEALDIAFEIENCMDPERYTNDQILDHGEHLYAGGGIERMRDAYAYFHGDSAQQARIKHAWSAEFLPHPHKPSWDWGELKALLEQDETSDMTHEELLHAFLDGDFNSPRVIAKISSLRSELSLRAKSDSYELTPTERKILEHWDRIEPLFDYFQSAARAEKRQ
jgi:hypothetical protein